MIIAECSKLNSCEKLEILSGDSIDDKLKWKGWTVSNEGKPICPKCSPLKLSEAAKLAGFKSAVQIVELAEVCRAKLYKDYDDRHRPLVKPVFYNHLRKAMDKKHMIERANMEAAILRMKESD